MHKVHNPTLVDGLRVYAEQQASIQHGLKQRFQHVWRNTQHFFPTADKAPVGDATDTELAAST